MPNLAPNDHASRVLTGLRRGCEAWGVPLLMFGAYGKAGSSNSIAFVSKVRLTTNSSPEGRPLLPLTSGTVSPGRSLKVIINLLAVVPLWRPLRLDAARSRLLVPSGVVPGDIVVGCVEFKCWSAGDGAGPDCVPLFLSKVRCANSKGWVVILQFLAALSVICTSGVDF